MENTTPEPAPKSEPRPLTWLVTQLVPTSWWVRAESAEEAHEVARAQGRKIGAVGEVGVRPDGAPPMSDDEIRALLGPDRFDLVMKDTLEALSSIERRLAALQAVQARREAECTPAELVCLVHDSIISEVRDDEVRRVKARIMRDRPTKGVPLVVEGEVKQNWGNVNAKKVDFHALGGPTTHGVESKETDNMSDTQDKPLKIWVATGGVAASTYIGKIEAATAEEALKEAWDSAHVSVCHYCSSAISDPEVTFVTVESADGESLSNEDEQKGIPPKRTFEELVANPPEGWEVVVMDGGHGVQFCRRNASGHILAIFGVLDGKVTNDWVAVSQGRPRQPMTLAERIKIHRDIVTVLESLCPSE